MLQVNKKSKFEKLLQLLCSEKEKIIDIKWCNLIAYQVISRRSINYTM